MKPAIYVMNKLPFKLKIIVAISILFVLLVLPSREVFTKYIYQNKIYQNQLIGLSYNQHIEEAIKIIQLHRGLSNAYLNGNKILKKKIEENEKDIDKIVLKLKVFDENHLNQLKYNKYFVDALSNLTIVKIGHLRSNINAEKVFKIHTHIINNLIKTVRNISKITSFSTSDDLKINYLGRLLEDKLLQLQENSGKIRGVAVGVFLKKNITNEEKSELLKLYTLIKSLESNILENQILTDMDSYFSVQKKTVLVSYKLNELLDIVNKNIITSDFQIYDHKKFFKQATEAIDKQVILYNILSKSYEGQINILKSKIFKEFIYILIRFLLIIAFSLYIITAFYISIVESLKKLQIASNMIAEGKSDIVLKADTKV
jgi:methyl-accepting chemotaxis protein